MDTLSRLTCERRSAWTTNSTSMRGRRWTAPSSVRRAAPAACSRGESCTVVRRAASWRGARKRWRSLRHRASCRCSIEPVRARADLRACAQADGLIARRCPRCCSCACATPGAVRWPRRCATSLADGRVEVRSAGSDPAEEITRWSIEAMARSAWTCRGVPQAADRRGRRAADVVVTMGCGDACPVYPGKRYAGLGGRRPAPASRSRPCGVIRDDIHEPRPRAARRRWSSRPARTRELLRPDGEASLDATSRRDHRHPRQPAGAAGGARARSTSSGSSRSTAAATWSATARIPTRSAR